MTDKPPGYYKTASRAEFQARLNRIRRGQVEEPDAEPDDYGPDSPGYYLDAPQEELKAHLAENHIYPHGHAR